MVGLVTTFDGLHSVVHGGLDQGNIEQAYGTSTVSRDGRARPLYAPQRRAFQSVTTSAWTSGVQARQAPAISTATRSDLFMVILISVLTEGIQARAGAGASDVMLYRALPEPSP